MKLNLPSGRQLRVRYFMTKGETNYYYPAGSRASLATYKSSDGSMIIRMRNGSMYAFVAMDKTMQEIAQILDKY